MRFSGRDRKPSSCSSGSAQTDPGHLALGYPGVRVEPLLQVVDRAGGDAVDVCLHDDRVEGLVDAPSSRGARCARWCGCRCARLLDADFCGGLGLDQFLQQSLGDLANEFKTLGRTQCLKQAK